MNRKLVSSLALILIVTGCTGNGVKEKDDKKVEKVAVVNGTPISRADYDEAFKAISGMKGMEHADSARQVLDELIRMELIVQDAKAKGVYESENIAEKVERFEKNMVVNAYIKKFVRDDIQVGKEEAEKFYNENADMFYDKDKVHAAHILVSSEKDAGDMIERLKKGAKFEELAKKYSLDPGSKDQGGDLGFFPKGAMVPEFDAAAFSTPVGQISDPVKTQFGYHIIKVYEQKQPEKVSFEAAEPRIRKMLLDRKQRESIIKITDALKGKANIEIISVN